MASAFAYPQTRRLNLVEDHFGQSVSDPYRWLEQDIRNDAETADQWAFIAHWTGLNVKQP